ncbi:NACHT domain-containing protein, partial [Spirilliplanes yamanashiensis]
RLASNPLLLTTLLLVRRGVGQLPRRRSILYGKAVEVLLMTWNVEGHTPVDPDEALPQLGFVAHWMMTNGKQTITDAELRRLLRQARSEMPDLLMHAKLGISEMIAKIEERSSLLTLAGHEVYDGTLQPFYEFKHLTFQEYLCARAITEKWLPQALSASSTLDLIKPRLGDSTWREVVVLTAALQGRSASAVVAEVIKKIRAVPRPARNTADDINRYDDRIFPLVSNLVGCLADDVPVAPELLDKALYHVVYMFEGDVALEVLGSRYEDSLRAYVQSRASIAKDLDPAVTLFVSLVGSEFVDQPVHKILDACAVELRRSDESGVLRGFALLVFACLYDGNALEPEVPRPIGKVHLSKWRKSFEIAASVLCADRLSPASKVLAIWAIGWRGLSVQSPELVNRLQQWLLRAWVNEPDRSSGIPWALMTTRIVGRWDIGDLNIEPTALDSFFSYQLEVRGESPRVMCAIYLCSYYLDLPWRRERIAEVMQGDQELGDARNRTEVEFAVRMFEALGEPVPDPFKKRSKLLRSRDR